MTQTSLVTPRIDAASFEAAARPLIEWLAANMHPHAKVIIESTHAELVEGIHVLKTMDYIRG